MLASSLRARNIVHDQKRRDTLPSSAGALLWPNRSVASGPRGMRNHAESCGRGSVGNGRTRSPKEVVRCPRPGRRAASTVRRAELLHLPLIEHVRSVGPLAFQHPARIFAACGTKPCPSAVSSSGAARSPGYRPSAGPPVWRRRWRSRIRVLHKSSSERLRQPQHV